MPNLRRKFKDKFQEKQDVSYTIAGLLGNSSGVVKVPNRNNYVYVRLAGSGVAEVFNNRVAIIFDLPVICGYDPVDPRRFQVLSIQGSTADAVGSSIIYGTGYAPSERYRWMYPGGGQDPLFSELRQWMPLRITPTAAMSFTVHNQVIWNGTEWEIFGGATETDLTSLVPTTSGKCCMVLISIDENGDIETTKGSEVNIADLVVTDIPEPPDHTRYVIGAIRLYYGQTQIQEARTNTDVVDLRFPQISGGVGLINIDYDESDVSNPPTQEEVSSAFGSPYEKGKGFAGLLNDGGLGTKEYLCVSDGTKWLLAPFSVARSSLAYETLTRYGVVLEAEEDEEYYIVEPTVIIEDGLWKMWYRAGWTNPSIRYATSPDGLNWTKYSGNPLLENYWVPHVIKVESTYHLFVTKLDWSAVDHFISSDGISWTLAEENAIVKGAAGSWEDDAIGGTTIWIEGGVWYVFYSASDGTSFKPGLAISSDGFNLVKYVGNPLETGETPVVTAGAVYRNYGTDFKVGGIYYHWGYKAPDDSFLPTDICRWTSSDMVNRVFDGYKLLRSGADEGEGSAVGQVGDPWIVVHNGVMYMFYEGSPDGLNAPSGVADSTNMKLVTGKESLIWE